MNKHAAWVSGGYWPVLAACSGSPGPEAPFDHTRTANTPSTPPNTISLDDQDNSIYTHTPEHPYQFRPFHPPSNRAPLGANGLKADVWLSGPESNVSSPPSPSTRHNHNLSLSIPSIPPSYQNPDLGSPSSLASSSAPFTDSFSSFHNGNIGQDYFRFDEASLSSATDPNLSNDEILASIARSNSQNQQQQQHPAYRQPASQPSSPSRGVYNQGSAPFLSQARRQRGATFSGRTFGGLPGFDGTLNPTVFTFNGNSIGNDNTVKQRQPVASAVPAHLAFTAIQSPASSLAASPVLGSSNQYLDQSFYSDGSGILNDELMEDNPTPVPPAISSSRKTSYSEQPSASNFGVDMSSELVDKLTLLDKIMNNAQIAKEALLRGEEVEAATNLGQISNHLEVASELGVGPAPTARDTPASSSVSPINYQQNNLTASPAPTNLSQAPTPVATPVNQVPIIAPTPTLLPALPVESNSATLRRAVVPGVSLSAGLVPGSQFTTAVPSAPASVADFTPGMQHPQSQMPQAPPLTHSHSFPNGHQLPSQLHGLNAPATPAAPSPGFTSALGIGHAPMVSSPLATMPVSRAPSPPRAYPVPDATWGEGSGTLVSQVHPSGSAGGGSGSSSNGATTSTMDMSRVGSEAGVTRRVSDGRPVINRSRSASVNKGWSTLPNMMSTVPPSAWPSRQPSPEYEEIESDDDELVNTSGGRKAKRRRSSTGKDDAMDTGFQAGPIISEDIRRQLDTIFEEFLNRVCSDIELTDSKGEKLHQTLMPKKMARLDESTDYRPFKFRIQAFVNSFHDELQARGITDETMSAKKIKTYLWRQDLISRFNSDGKKAKSKGNHIWNVDAKKLPGGGWVFRPFKRRILGQPHPFAIVNHRYEWEPKIWDPQAASETLRPVFSSPPGSLPSWLSWEDEGTKLVGTPTEHSEPFVVTAIAQFTDGTGTNHTLETSFNVQAVLPHMISDPAAIYAQAQAQAHVEAQLQAHAESQAAQAQQAQIQAQVEAHHAQQAARLHAMQSQAQFMPGGQWTQEFVNPAAAGGMMPIGGGPPLFTMGNMAYQQPYQTQWVVDEDEEL